MWNDIEESQSWLRITDGIEECISHWRSAAKGCVRSVECIIGAPVGIEEFPFQADERRKGGYRVQNGIEER